LFEIVLIFHNIIVFNSNKCSLGEYLYFINIGNLTIQTVVHFEHFLDINLFQNRDCRNLNWIFRGSWKF